MTNVFIFLIKQRTEWFSLDWDTDNECKERQGSREELPGPTKKTEHLNDMHKNSSHTKSTQKFWRGIILCLCLANKRIQNIKNACVCRLKY